MSVSDQLDPDWYGYECKPGQLLFYYNKTTGEHRWNNNIPIKCEPFDDGYREWVSIKTEHDPCVDECLSMYIDASHDQETDHSDSQVNTEANYCKPFHIMENVSSQTNKVQGEVAQAEDNGCTSSSMDNIITMQDCPPKENDEITGADESNCEDLVGKTYSCVERTDTKRTKNISHDAQRSNLANENTKQQPAQRPKRMKDLTSNAFSMSTCSKGGRHEVLDCQDQSMQEMKRGLSCIKPYKCTYCNKAFTRHSVVKVHERVHTGAKPYKCTYCKKAFRQQGHLGIHERLHTGVKPYKCAYCIEAFTRQICLKRHERFHTGVKSYKCKCCNKTFARKDNLNVHKLVHTGLKPYKCARCDKEFKRNDYLKAHELAHIGVKPYKCTYCGKAFMRQGHLKQHERAHTGIKAYKCTTCAKAFTYGFLLKKHERIHTGVKPYKCTYCNNAYTQQGDLKRHERIHTGMKKTCKCTYCNKAFTRQGDLERHERIHTGVKPYKCTYCNKAFTLRGNFKKHERIHTGVLPYKCAYCEKAFGQRYYLKVHERIHTGVKPYKCTHCNKAFTQQCTLNRHERIHIDRGRHLSKKTLSTHEHEDITKAKHRIITVFSKDMLKAIKCLYLFIQDFKIRSIKFCLLANRAFIKRQSIF
ncbi:zinc finger protein 2-like isoform X4 [Actinia tenebrosa]|uniref:Zinc finger protein 2-like isoform X4 n=1 Tax=Actinia tenebrosa TaxID=6105 RepID=A0A6P8IQ57_ACTTE|nr:zinc finger protein 2-like isoform X4 [Actinia tenebrosa]